MIEQSLAGIDQLALDVNAPNRLKALAQQQPQAALQQSAKQFEALFINMMLQTMRKASGQRGGLHSHEKTLYTSMLDQQFSQLLAHKGMGLAELMLGQLHRLPATGTPVTMASAPSKPLAETVLASNPVSTGLQTFAMRDLDALLAEQTVAEPAKDGVAKTVRVQNFRQRMADHARLAEQQTGIPADFILAQAAMESGWGQRQIRSADGQPSHNLFGIKAGSDWNGAVTEVTTTEYRDGVAYKTAGRFRAYASEAEAFADYAQLLKQSPRYRGLLANGQTAQGFAQGLQQAGYATDPNYAHKLLQVIRTLAAT